MTWSFSLPFFYMDISFAPSLEVEDTVSFRFVASSLHCEDVKTTDFELLLLVFGMG